MGRPRHDLGRNRRAGDEGLSQKVEERRCRKIKIVGDVKSKLEISKPGMGIIGVLVRVAHEETGSCFVCDITMLRESAKKNKPQSARRKNKKSAIIAFAN